MTPPPNNGSPPYILVHTLAADDRFISAYFHFESVRDRQEEVEVLVSRAGVRMVFPLWKDPKDKDKKEEKEGDYEAPDAGPVFVYGRASIRIRLEWTEIDGKRPGAARECFTRDICGVAWRGDGLRA